MRLLLLVAASLMGPAVLVYQWITGEPIDVPVIAAGCVIIFLLVILRLGARRRRPARPRWTSGACWRRSWSGARCTIR